MIFRALSARAPRAAVRTFATARPQVLLLDDILLAHGDLQRLEASATVIVRTPC